MKIPQPTQIMEIEYNGERLDAVVDSVTLIEPGIHRLRLRIGRKIRKGEHVDLLTEEGAFPSAVHETQTRDHDVLIELRAYEGARPKPQ